MYQQFSPNMLKTFEQCPRKYEFRYLHNISMPVNDDIFEFGKNIHALASYYLRGENIDKMENSLSPREFDIWSYLKSSKYFAYDVIGTEYNLSVKIDKHFYGGRLDALVKNDNEYYILDYKTGAAPQNAEYDYQTMIYILCVKEFFNTQNISFIYLDLQHRKEVVIKYSKELDKIYHQRLISISGKIDTYETKYNKKQPICNCEYSLICY